MSIISDLSGGSEYICSQTYKALRATGIDIAFIWECQNKKVGIADLAGVVILLTFQNI